MNKKKVHFAGVKVDSTREDVRYRAIDIKIKDLRKNVSFLEIIWGTDIFINGFPILKILIATNILVWLLMILFIK